MWVSAQGHTLEVTPLRTGGVTQDTKEERPHVEHGSQRGRIRVPGKVNLQECESNPSEILSEVCLSLNTLEIA